MAIEISPSEEHEPDEPQQEAEGQPTALQPVPPQDSPAQFYEWALRREQVRLRKVIWSLAIFAALTVLLLGLLSYFMWDTRRDDPSASGDVVEQQPDAAAQASVDELRDEFAALSERVDRLAGSGLSEEDLGEIVGNVERVGRRLAQLNRQTTAAVACLNGAIASLDEAVRDLLRQDISANEFVQRPASNCG
ncbi:MAG: hypothetical protein ACRDLB_11830 [Actinomycetota bacterium]